LPDAGAEVSQAFFELILSRLPNVRCYVSVRCGL
jgi:hypothetical protein